MKQFIFTKEEQQHLHKHKAIADNNHNPSPITHNEVPKVPIKTNVLT